jgi:diadenosine tetraphosphate (Ap4A) HIT family hydrolase
VETKDQSLIHRRVAAAERGENPTVICRMRSGYLVLCDRQTPRGWCILLSVPVVADLDDLDEQRRAWFLSDMAAVGEALKRVTGAYRINYSILGNTDPALHAHIQPRFADEPEELRRQPLWAIWGHLRMAAFDAERDGPLMAQIRKELAAMGRCADRVSSENP